jgi:PBP1b-binding outer membrane lipoprotein LpoB
LRTHNAVWIALAALAVLAAGCASHKVVSRVDVNEQIDLSGNWNDTDSRQVAGDLVNQVFTASPWRDDYLEAKGSRPTLIVGRIANKSVEHIPVKTFVGDLERSFINSGKVRVVASSEEREGVRDERADQQEFASPETIKRWGKERGADFMLLGEINTLVDREGGDEVKYYQVDSYLVNLESNEKVWAGITKIKKFVGRSAYKP